jgi:hypothetical protein
VIGAGIIALGLPLYWYFGVAATKTGAADPLVSEDDA